MKLFTKKRKKNSDGFTVIETIIALVISSFIIISIASLFSSFLLVKRANNNLLKAIMIAEDTIEFFRNKSYSEISNLSNYSTTTNNYYTQNVEIAPVDGINNVIKITTSIQWEEGNRPNNKYREYKIETYVSKNGLNRFISGSE